MKACVCPTSTVRSVFRGVHGPVTSKGQHKLKEFHGTVNLGFGPHHLPFEVRPCRIRRSWPNLKRRSLPRLPWSIALNILLSHKRLKTSLSEKTRLKTTVTNLCSKGSTRMMEHLIVSHFTCICKNPGTEADVDEHVEVALRSMMFFASFIFSMSPNADACFYFRASDKMKLKQQCGHQSTKLKSKKLHLNTTMIPEFSRVWKTMLAHTHFLWDRSLWAECPAAKRTKRFHHAATEKYILCPPMWRCSSLLHNAQIGQDPRLPLRFAAQRNNLATKHHRNQHS